MVRYEPQKIVFTDIDGTLIDMYTGKFKGTDRLIKILIKNRVPVVLCSAKTRSEQEYIRANLGLSDPFIIENGGAVVIPDGYFDDQELNMYTMKDGYHLIEIGGRSSEIKEKLSRIRKEFKIEFKGASDLTLNELSKKLNMSLPFARRMSRREYGETILEIDHQDLNRFIKICKENGLKVIHGGRYIDITLGNDKGKATQVLIDLFKKKYLPRDAIFIGFGDSENDLPMLRLMDRPVLVQRTDGSWYESKMKNVIKSTGIGPVGWKNSFNLITDYRSQMQ
jgi:mannosyl-3-phosphoglycerate phosphatase